MQPKPDSSTKFQQLLEINNNNKVQPYSTWFTVLPYSFIRLLVYINTTGNTNILLVPVVQKYRKVPNTVVLVRVLNSNWYVLQYTKRVLYLYCRNTQGISTCTSTG